MTGASGGIGSAIARKLAGCGAAVGIHYNSSAAQARALADEPVFRSGGVSLCQADLTDEGAAEALWRTIGDALGPIDILVANAGCLDEIPLPLRHMDMAQWQRTLERNLTVTFLTMREFLRGIERWSIADPAAVIITSMSGVWGQPGHGDYAAAKAGMNYGLLPTVKDEIVKLAPRGRVNAIAPGFVATKMIRNKLRDVKAMKRALQTASLRKLATPDDIANLAVFLASNELSGHITGEVIRVTGGKEGRVLFDEAEISFMP
ncbi:MAG: SDR family NAD(P)-dependent oxidoreductase [Parvibaculaceae bacterium]